jgi:hypothetical protein
LNPVLSTKLGWLWKMMIGARKKNIQQFREIPVNVRGTA